MAAQERSIALDLEYMRRRYPGVEPGKGRRGLISAATECSEPTGGSRGKFLEPEAARKSRMVAAERPLTTWPPVGWAFARNP